MNLILDRNGDIIQQSRSLRGIRTFVIKNRPNAIKIWRTGSDLDEGELQVVFPNGDNFETEFASFEVLKGWVKRWRNVHGVPLAVEGNAAGTVSKDNPALN